MKRTTILLLLVINVIASLSFGQGTNNDFDFDNTDLEFLFSKLGYGVFKFPVKQSKNQVFDIVVEEYRGGELTNRKTAVEMTQEAFKDFGIDAKTYARPKMDSTQLDSIYFHRFYFEKSDTILKLHLKSHGITAPVEFNIKDLTLGDVRARYETKEEIDSIGYIDMNVDKRLLILFYANKDPNMPLWCPAGLPIDQLKKKFYYTVFVYISKLE